LTFTSRTGGMESLFERNSRVSGGGIPLLPSDRVSRRVFKKMVRGNAFREGVSYKQKPKSMKNGDADPKRLIEEGDLPTISRVSPKEAKSVAEKGGGG